MKSGMLTDWGRKPQLQIRGAYFIPKMEIVLGSSVYEEWSLKQSSIFRITLAQKRGKKWSCRGAKVSINVK